jgi:hypothetical protein
MAAELSLSPGNSVIRSRPAPWVPEGGGGGIRHPKLTTRNPPGTGGYNTYSFTSTRLERLFKWSDARVDVEVGSSVIASCTILKFIFTPVPRNYTEKDDIVLNPCLNGHLI